MHWIHEAALWIVNVVHNWGYPGILVAMCLESTFFPLPSELVIPPAGYLAYRGDMNVAMVILMGTLGSMMGASINYLLALWLGRPFFLRYGKYFLCPPHKFEKVERFFLRHGEFGTFTGRLLLGVRHFISFPAGLARMNWGRFLLYTGVGSAIWCTVLAVLGWWIGRVASRTDPEQLNDLFSKYGKNAGYGTAAVCALLIAGYVWWHRRRSRVPGG